jgi:hypothetical protein
MFSFLKKVKPTMSKGKTMKIPQPQEPTENRKTVKINRLKATSIRTIKATIV